jgi:hypothetical protein
MIMGIAALVFIPLLAVAIAYFMWALGRTWPLKDKQLLAQAITGRPGRTGLPSRWIFLVVAAFMLAAGIAALSLADHDAGGVWLNALGIALGLLFLARGVAGYTAGWRRTFSAEPFVTLDRKTYSPLALFLGAGFLLLVILRLT